MNFHRFLVFKRYIGSVSPERFFYPNSFIDTRFYSRSLNKRDRVPLKSVVYNSSIFLFKNKNKPNNLLDKVNKNINKNKLDNTCWQYIWKLSQKY